MAIPRRRSSRYKRPRKVERPRTTWKCRWVPRRKNRRTWTESAVARVYCKCLEEGGSRALIEEETQKRCGVRVSESQFTQPGQARNIWAFAADEITKQQTLWSEVTMAMGIVNGFLAVLLVLLGIVRFVGPLRLIATPSRTGVRLAQVQTQQLIARIQSRVRANDELQALFKKFAEDEVARRTFAGG